MKRKKTKKELAEAKQHRKEYLRQWYLNNKSTVLKQRKEYYEANREKMIEYAIEYQTKHEDKQQVYNMRHYLKLKAGLI